MPFGFETPTCVFSTIYNKKCYEAFLSRIIHSSFSKQTKMNFFYFFLPLGYATQNHIFKTCGILSSHLSERVYIEGQRVQTFMTIGLDIQMSGVGDTSKIRSRRHIKSASKSVPSKTQCSSDTERNEKLTKLSEDKINDEIVRQFKGFTKGTLMENSYLPEKETRKKRETGSDGIEEIIFR